MLLGDPQEGEATMSRMMKNTRVVAALTAAALSITACGGGSESSEDSIDRNTAISAQSLQRLLPVGFSVAPGEKAAVVIGGGTSEMCSIDHTGTLWCWGRPSTGLVQVQAPSVSPTPVRIPMPNNQYVTAVSSGPGDATCAIAGGEVFCWGLNNSRIVASNGSYYTAPTRVGNIGSPAVDIAVSSTSACAVVANGAVLCWGDGRQGTMTQEAFVDYNIRGPVTLPFINNAVKITGGFNNFCVISVNAMLQCWGRNANGQLGPGGAEPVFAARQPLLQPGVVDVQVVDVSMGTNHTCAVLTIGSVKCFGQNVFGQLGLDSAVVPSSAVPRAADGFPWRALAINASQESTCVNDIEGQVWCWGRLPGTQRDVWQAQKLVGMSNVMALGGNKRLGGTVCSATWEGRLLCAGYDATGDLGNGAPVGSASSSAVTIAGFGITPAQNVGTTTPLNTVPVTTAAPQTTVPATVPATVTVPTVATTVAVTVATTTPSSDSAQVQGSPSTTTGAASTPATTSSGASQATASTGGDATAVTVPAVTSPSTVRRVLSVKVGKKVDAKTMTVFAGISAPKSSKVKVTVSKAGTRFCRTSGTSVQGKKVGVCSVTVGVTPKGQKTRSRTIFVNVVA